MGAIAFLLLWRGLHVAALWLAFGSLVATASFARAMPARHRLATIGLMAALIFAVPWFMLVAGDDGGLGLVVKSWFGHVMLGRMLLVVVALGLLGAGAPLLAILPAGIALASETLISHPGATAWPGMLAGALHLLAGGAWIGGLPILLLALRRPDAIDAARRFGWLGGAAVVVLAATAAFLGNQEIGNLAGLFGTRYGRLGLLKGILFAGLIALAMLNRFRWLPRQNTAALRWTIVAELVTGLVILGVAILLANGTPAIHQQPIWPFAFQFSLVALRSLLAEDPELARGPMLALAVLGVAGLSVVFGLWRRRWAPALVVTPLALIWALPQLSLLLLPATPTSFFQSPTGFSAASIVAGQAVFSAHCANCHGAAGRGDGPRAAILALRPADLTAPHLLEHPDGELFGWLTDGIKGPAGAASMPGFAAVLTDTERWAVIDYIRANNAGRAMAAGEGWAQALAAPDMPLDCGPFGALHDLAGQSLILAADRPAGPMTTLAGLRVIHLDPMVPGCAAASQDGWRAYAILAGLRADRLDGMFFMVDATGWLRGASALADGQKLPEAAIRALLSEPLPQAKGSPHVH